MKIVTVVGARPQFVKAAAISRAIRTEFSSGIQEVLVHTGQHYDKNMSDVFFDELDIPRPNYNLEISGGNHGAMTGRMLESIEKVILQESPDWLLIYGDTNSTLAGALAAAKLHVPVAHVEAGLRSFNMRMPEEINRILSDRVSKLLFCPTDTAVQNLASEGVRAGVHNVGDVMYDVALFFRDKARESSGAMVRLGLRGREFALATCHRAENTDDPVKLKSILAGLAAVAERMPVVLPLHPRTRKLARDYRLESYLDQLMVVDPLPFLDMVALEQAAQVILTDSGGVQKEAFFFQVPCITLREETEWVETVSSGWNTLVGSDSNRIRDAFDMLRQGEGTRRVGTPYGNGNASKRILELLVNELS
ncbi:WecB UDP-N-acetylglucosamine 2-epimerase [Comamonadaceae bacterium]